MTRKECEKRIFEQMQIIRDIYKEYRGNVDYLTLRFIEGGISFNNEYWEEDKEKQINFNDGEVEE